MSFTQKINVLDMIIETLREHEKALDDIVQRLEALQPKRTFKRQV